MNKGVSDYFQPGIETEFAMKKNVIILISLLTVLAFSAVGCGEKNYKDGVYTAKSQEYTVDEENGEDEGGNGYGEVTITVKDNKVTNCTFYTYELDGTLKDENYGKEGGNVANRDFYNKAQKAVSACSKYAEQLAEKGSLDGVDAISGATINYNEFREAVQTALKEAEE